MTHESTKLRSAYGESAGGKSTHAAGPASEDPKSAAEQIARLCSELQGANATIRQLQLDNEEEHQARWHAEILGRERARVLQALVDTQAHALRAMHDTASWRITRPLRDLLTWVKQSTRGWHARRLYARLRARSATAQPQAALHPTIEQGYADWIERFDQLSKDDIYWIRHHIASARLGPIHIVWGLQDATAAEVLAAIDSLQIQYLQNWTALLWLNGRAQVDATVSARVQADARLQIGADRYDTLTGAQQLRIDRIGRLAPHALYLLVEAALRTGAPVVLADEDLQNAEERHSPRFLPAYSPEFPTTGSLALFTDGSTWAPHAENELHTCVARAVGDTGQLPAHVPFVLFHAQQAPSVQGTENDRLCVGDRAAWPSITIIIPTRDRFELMAPCLASIFERTDYPRDRYEVVVVDNGSVEKQLLDHLAQLERAGQVRVIKDPSKFNYARLNNLAVAATQGDLLAFVNNDIVVHDALWLQRLAAQATKPDVGVVGAKLLYPDHTVQHGGVVLGIQGVAAHAHHNLAADAPGYLGLAVNTHAISAITGACMMVQREVFQAVGGFDEQLAVAFNDTLLCMDVLALGLRNMYVAQPLLIHYESKTRGLDDSDAKRALFRREARYARSRHRDLFKNDPCYSPNLSLDHPYVLAFPPRHAKPWHAFRRRDGRMRILLLSVIHQIGYGVPVVVDIHARHLAGEGHDVFVGGPAAEREFDYAECIRVHLNSPQEAAAFAVQNGMDCVVMHTPPFFSTMRWLGSDIKTVVYDHGEPPPDFFPDAQVRRAVLSEKDFCLEMADALYANSEATRNESGHERMGVIPLGNTHLAQWTPDREARRHEVRQALGLDDKIVVLNVCRFHKNERHYKGIEDYCRLWETLQREFPTEAHRFVFALVGKGTTDDVKTMESRGLRVFANVSDAQMLDMYCCADLYANFSKWEGYNLGIGQALAMGLEVVASDIPAHRAFSIFTSDTASIQAHKLMELSSIQKTRVARAIPWAPTLKQLSGSLKEVLGTTG